MSRSSHCRSMKANIFNITSRKKTSQPTRKIINCIHSIKMIVLIVKASINAAWIPFLRKNPSHSNFLMCRWFPHYKNQCLLSLSLAQASWSAPRHHHVAVGRRRTHVGGGRAVRIVRVNRDGPTNGLAQGSIFSATMAWCFGGRCSFFLLSQSR